MRRNQARTFGLLVLLVLLALSIGSPPARARDYPARPIRILVGQAPGGGTDVTGRLIANEMARVLGQSVYIENRTGAAGSIAAAVAAKSAPDGYTLVLVSSSYAINPNFMKLSFDPVQDLVPVSLLVKVPFVLNVRPDLPVNGVRDLLAMASAGNVAYGSGGPGSSGHLAAVLLGDMAHVRFTHVPYRGAGPALVDLMAGQVQFMFDSVLSSTPLIRQGTLRPLAVTSERRLAALPDVPAVAESGVPGYVYGSWYGLLAPRGTPPDVLGVLAAAADKAAHARAVMDTLRLDGATPVGGSPETFRAFMAEELTRYRELAAAANLPQP
jgi:tripartite-type tricarboxylate transporter receptor subunit TctC